MPQMVNLGRELVRINMQKNCVEYSQNRGRSWVVRCSSSSYGEFRDLLEYGSELLACTSKGLYVSTNEGRSFAPRCTNSSYGDFLNLLPQSARFRNRIACQYQQGTVLFEERRTFVGKEVRAEGQHGIKGFSS